MIRCLLEFVLSKHSNSKTNNRRYHLPEDKNLKKLYAVLIFELVIMLIFEILIGCKIIRTETNKFIEMVKSDMPKMESEMEWVDPAIADANREKAIADYKEFLRLKKLGLVTEESEDLGFVPGTYQWEMQQKALEEEEHEDAIIDELNALRENHDTTLGSVEDRFGDMNYDLDDDAKSTLRAFYTDLLSDISYEVYDNEVFYIYTYLPGKDPNPEQIISLDISVVEDEKDVIENLTGKRPERLTILYLSSNGDVLYELTN